MAIKSIWYWILRAWAIAACILLQINSSWGSIAPVLRAIFVFHSASHSFRISPPNYLRNRLGWQICSWNVNSLPRIGHPCCTGLTIRMMLLELNCCQIQSLCRRFYKNNLPFSSRCVQIVTFFTMLYILHLIRILFHSTSMGSVLICFPSFPGC